MRKTTLNKIESMIKSKVWQLCKESEAQFYIKNPCGYNTTLYLCENKKKKGKKI